MPKVRSLSELLADTRSPLRTYISTISPRPRGYQSNGETSRSLTAGLRVPEHESEQPGYRGERADLVLAHERQPLGHRQCGIVAACVPGPLGRSLSRQPHDGCCKAPIHAWEPS